MFGHLLPICGEEAVQVDRNDDVDDDAGDPRGHGGRRRRHLHRVCRRARKVEGVRRVTDGPTDRLARCRLPAARHRAVTNYVRMFDAHSAFLVMSDARCSLARTVV